MGDIIVENTSINNEPYQRLRRDHTLSVVEIASTSTLDRGFLGTNLDPRNNPKLAEALKIYAKHYLATQDGIKGEGENVQTILSRLQGNDENVKKMTILGLQDGNGKIVGVSFVETYPIKDAVDHADKKVEDGLVHLATYAAVEQPYDKTEVNTAFHAVMMDKIRLIDSELGMPGKSVLVAEVNSVLGFDREKQSNKMEGEFEIKTGVPRKYRETYELGMTKDLIPIVGKYGRSHVLGVTYPPPNLGEDDERKIHPDDVKSASGLAQLLRNQDIEEGRGETLFLTTTNPYAPSLHPYNIAWVKKFVEQLYVSVAQENHGIEYKQVILDALGHPINKSYKEGIEGLDNISKQLTQTPQTSVLRVANWSGRNSRETGQKIN